MFSGDLGWDSFACILLFSCCEVLAISRWVLVFWLLERAYGSWGSMTRITSVPPHAQPAKKLLEMVNKGRDHKVAVLSL